MPLSEHIGELRARLRTIFLAFVIVFAIIIFFPANPIQQVQNLGQYLNLQFLENTVIATFLHRVSSDLLPTGWSLIAANGLGEGMEIYFVASFMLSLAICMPVIAYETYKFIDPALRQEERRLLYPFVLSTSSLFIVGLIFGYFVLAKFLLIALSPFFLATSTQFILDSAAFYYLVFLLIGATGASFTLPVFIYALIRLRVLDPAFFSRNRVVIWFILWVITGLFLTPDGGPLLDLALFVPIVVLVELAVWFGKRGLRGTGNAPASDQCRHCGSPLRPGQFFCPKCARSTS